MIKINKIYVINLKHNKNKWKEIQKAFKNTPLKLNRFDAIYGKNLTDEEIKKVTTNFCYYFCSPGMIGCWLSHYKIWQQIIKNNEDNVLILEDDAYPTENFNKRLKEILKEIPPNYDLVYFGCSGSCDQEFDWINNLYYGKNKTVYYNNKKLKNLIRPTKPFYTHAYLISNKGAKKFINNK